MLFRMLIPVNYLKKLTIIQKLAMFKKNPDVTKLVANTALNTKIEAVEKKIPNVSKWVTNNVLDTKTGEVKNKIPDVSQLVTNNSFDEKLRNINQRVTSNNTRHLEAENKYNIPNGANIFLKMNHKIIY